MMFKFLVLLIVTKPVVSYDAYGLITVEILTKIIQLVVYFTFIGFVKSKNLYGKSSPIFVWLLKSLVIIFSHKYVL